MTTAITRIQLKYSTGTSAPASLVAAEPAYSYASNTFFIGSPTGDGVIAIGGKFYLDQQQLAWDHANAAFASANAGTGAVGAYNHANAAFDTANGAVAVNLTQNNSITAAFNTGNSAFIQANSGFNHANAAFTSANAINGVNLTQNNSITFASDTANAAFSNANSYITRNEAVNVTQNNRTDAAFTRANNSLNANTGGTVNGDVSITGNLIVTGNVVSISTTEIVSNDSLIVLGVGNYTSDIVDIGLVAHYNDGVNAHSGIIRDATNKEYYVFDGYTPEVGANNNINTSDPSFRVSTLNANLKSQTVQIKGIDILPYANGIYNAANAAFTRANNSLNANTGGQVTGNISVGGTITPNADVTYNLGSASNRWHSLFVGAGTIDIGGLTISNTKVGDFDTANFGGVQDIKLTNAAVGSFRQVANTGNAAFNHANAVFANSNTYITYNEAVSITQNNNITAARNTANAAFVRANNSLDANNGGSVSGTILSTANVRADYIVANTGFASAAGLSRLQLGDIGLAAIQVAGQEYKFGASGIETNKGIFGGSFGGNRLSLDGETNLISNRYDVVKIQTGTDGTTPNEFVFSNNSLTVPGGITANGFTAGGINVVPTLAASFNTANAAFLAANAATATDATQNNSITASFAHANAAFDKANNSTDVWVRNQANSAFDAANGAVAVNLTQNNSITVALNTANAAFANANSYITYNEAVNVTQNNSIAAAFAAANAATATDATQNNSITASFAHANAAYAAANAAASGSATDSWARNQANASFTRANNSLDANNGGTITGDVIINANLFVNGTTTYVNTVNQLIGDNIITLNADIPQNGTPTQDAGFEVDRGIQPNSSFLWIESAGKFSANNGNTAFYVADEAVVVRAYNHANAAFDKANNSTDVWVRNQANSAFDTANGAVAVNFTQNNSITASFAHANAAYAAANSGASATYAFYQANAAFNHANAGFNKANTADTNAGNAQSTADSAYTSACNALVAAATAQDTGNAAFSKANAAFAQANSYATASASVFNGTGDGTTTSFNLGYTPVSDGSASVVSIDGIVQYEGTYTISTGNTSINFSDAPASGERIRVLAYTSVNPYVLGSTGVSAGTYGNANTIAVFTTAANGQLTFASNVAIAIGAGQITSGTLPVSRGGTGAGTFTTNGVLIGQGTDAFQTASSSTEGHVLTINSSGVPVFGYINGGTF